MLIANCNIEDCGGIAVLLENYYQNYNFINLYNFSTTIYSEFPHHNISTLRQYLRILKYTSNNQNFTFPSSISKADIKNLDYLEFKN